MAEPDRVQQRPGGRSARVRDAVLTATMDVLADGGLTRLNVEDVAARAGVHKTTVYRRWGTREALVLDALLARSAEQVEIPDTGRFDEDLRRLLRAIRANITSAVGRATLLALTQEAEHSAELAALRHQFWDQRFTLAGVIVERAIARGGLPEGTDPHALLEVAIGPLYLRAVVTGEPIDDDVIEAVVARLR